MNNAKTTFALYFGNRGFFPASLIASARQELADALKRLGHGVLMLDAGATRHGAVETVREGEIYAEFLRQHRGEFGGVVLSLPNFGDETGAVAALKEAGVPILIQAYPDELNKMAPALRRDAFCGKFSIMDVFYQYRVPFTTLKPHTVHPSHPRFAAQVDYFDRLCRTVNGLRGMVVGAVGARTTPFKTVRVDELTLQRHGITVETMDLADVIGRAKALKATEAKVKGKMDALKAYADVSAMPKEALENMARLGVVLDGLIEEVGLDALAIRCWLELQQQLGVSPCVLLSEINDRGIAAACEVDVANAVTMHALSLASGGPSMLLDWNNNYGDEENKCIVFHCGPVPQSLMTGRGKVTDHAILMNAVGPGCSFGPNTGRIAPMPTTFSGLLTEDGKMKFYLGEGRFTEDPIPADFFGCAGVLEVPRLQDGLHTLGHLGHRHHVSLTRGHVLAPVQEALTRYLAADVVVI
jgi:L-fucose isomerase-like protein